ncbi:LacI family transcriptional regulator [bacterium]|nr:MAG: LacI family transcriptional regulator [bacterium]
MERCGSRGVRYDSNTVLGKSDTRLEGKSLRLASGSSMLGGDAMAGKRPTRRDVAEKAGVAPSTVSLILGDRSEALGIAPATRQRVEDAAKALGYYPNRHIRAVRSGRTGILGLYLRSDQWGTSTGYWAAMRGALERAVSEADLQLLVHCAPEGCLTEEAFARQAGGVVDGVIILNSGQDPIANRLIETGMRAVEIGDRFSPLPYVAIDDASGVVQTMEHLAARGYRRPAFVNFQSPYEGNPRQRQEAFLEAGRRLFGEESVCLEVRDEVQALDGILALDPRPDAAVCSSDELAFGMLSLARSRGIRVPEELALVGFDCIPTLGATLTMTSVCTPMGDMARLGVQKLLDLIEGKAVAAATILPVTLFVAFRERSPSDDFDALRTAL